MNKSSKRYIALFLMSVFSFMLFYACQNGISTNPDIKSLKNNKNEETKFSKLNNDDLNNIQNSLDILANVLTRTLTNSKIRDIIYKSVGKKFDGDYDVLYKKLKDNNIFMSKLKNSASKIGMDKVYFTELLSQIPKLQIAVPVNYMQWDYKTFIPLVAFRIYDKDDRDIERVKAYDATGKIHWLDAKEKPSMPIIVVGINERTDLNGNVIYAQQCSGCGGSGGSGGSGGTGGGNNNPVYKDKVYINDFRLMDTSEGWFDGNPEIYVKTFYKGVTTRTDFPDVNNVRWYHENDFSWLPKAIYSTTGYIDLNDVVNVDVWEEDVIWDDHLEGHWSVIDRPYAGDVTDNIEGYKNNWSWGYDYRTLYDGGSGNSDLIMYGKTVLE